MLWISDEPSPGKQHVRGSVADSLHQENHADTAHKWTKPGFGIEMWSQGLVAVQAAAGTNAAPDVGKHGFHRLRQRGAEVALVDALEDGLLLQPA
jgi:hypothetical protein